MSQPKSNMLRSLN